MQVTAVILIAIALGSDALSMTVGLGIIGINRIKGIIISAVVAVFHIVLPLIGLYIGFLFGKLIGAVASIIGALVLVFLGGSMIWNSIKNMTAGKKNVSILKRILEDEERSGKPHFVKGAAGIIALAGGVSIDALSAGFGLGTLNADVFLTLLTFGVVAGLMSVFGFLFGAQLGEKFGEKAQLIGGLILIATGFIIFLGVIL